MQGFNMGRYIPPSALDPTLSSTRTGGFNSQGHPLGHRARKLATEGALTVRFEMPFRIWCLTCKPESIIDQGVRFNAEKKNVGKYYSSTIWAFRMKHTACGGIIEVRTDPQNSRYVVTEGARARDFGEVSTEGAFGEIITEEERERRKGDAMAALEGKVKEKETVKSEVRGVDDLLEFNDKYWEDPYSVNSRMRKSHRALRKVEAFKQKDREEIAERLGLGFEILDATQEDKKRAGLVEFGDADGVGLKAIARSTTKPLFESPSITKAEKTSKVKKTKAELKTERTKTTFQQEIKGNTRATKDPFLLQGHLVTKERPTSALFNGLKRKRVEAEERKVLNIRGVPAISNDAEKHGETAKVQPFQDTTSNVLSLVGYESDDDE